MDQETKDKIESSDVNHLSIILNNIQKNIDGSGQNPFEHIKFCFRGLGSHNPEKRSGYSILLTTILEKNKQKINEDEVYNFVSSLDFTQKKNKSSKRTSHIARILSVVILIKTKVFRNENYVRWCLFEVIIPIIQSNPRLQAFANVCLSNILREIDFLFFNEVRDSIPNNLESYVFWINIVPYIPEDKKDLIQEDFRSGVFSVVVGESIRKHLKESRPWDSLIWKVIVQKATDDELMTLWPSILYQETRSTDDKSRFKVIQITYSVISALRPSSIPIVCNSTFIKMLNNLINKPQISEIVLRFLEGIKNINDNLFEHIIDAFSYISAVENGLAFHRSMFEKSNVKILKYVFDRIKNVNKDDEDKFNQCTSSKKHSLDTFQIFNFNKIRALFISTGKFSVPELTVEIFNYILEKWDRLKDQLVQDLITYDESKIEGAATFQDIINDKNSSHFEACFRLYSHLTGATSSPSSNTLIIPNIVQPVTIDTIHYILAQKSNESPLLNYAYKCFLKNSDTFPPRDDIIQFIDNYSPADDTFTSNTISIIQTIIEKCNLTLNAAPSLFSLYCRTLANCTNALLAESISSITFKMIQNKNPTESETEYNFSLTTLLKSMFNSMKSISNSTFKKNRKDLVNTFNKIIKVAVRAKVPFTSKISKEFVKILDEAIEMYVMKSSPHFDEDIFSNIIEFPSNASHPLFVSILKILPKVQKLNKRQDLFKLLRIFFNNNHWVQGIVDNKDVFNSTLILLVGEKHIKDKMTEKLQQRTFEEIKFILDKLLENRHACESLNHFDIRKKIDEIISKENNTVAEIAKTIRTTLQKIEQKTPFKKRNKVQP